MNRKHWLILALMLTMLILPACTPVATQVVPTTPSDACPSETADLKLLMNVEDGYCLLYPADYSLNIPHYIVINPIPSPGDIPGDAWASIYMEDAGGRTAAQVADADIAAVGTGFNITKSDVLVDSKQAVVVDGLPGQDSNRRVYIVSNERLYTLMFAPWSPNTNNPGQSTLLEGLYGTIIDTLHFLPPTKALPTPTQPWGPNHLPPPLVFEYPADQQILDYEGSYLFKVTDIKGAEGYLWSFSQNGVVVWENLRDEKGFTAGGAYEIPEGSEAHSRFMPGPVEVVVRAKMGDYLTDPAVITILLQPR